MLLAAAAACSPPSIPTRPAAAAACHSSLVGRGEAQAEGEVDVGQDLEAEVHDPEHGDVPAHVAGVELHELRWGGVRGGVALDWLWCVIWIERGGWIEMGGVGLGGLVWCGVVWGPIDRERQAQV